MALSSTVRSLIEQYRLRPHPEGGWFREFYRSSRSVGIPEGYPGARVALTSLKLEIIASLSTRRATVRLIY
jgi:uncharacterized protein